MFDGPAGLGRPWTSALVSDVERLEQVSGEVEATSDSDSNNWATGRRRDLCQVLWQLNSSSRVWGARDRAGAASCWKVTVQQGWPSKSEVGVCRVLLGFNGTPTGELWHYTSTVQKEALRFPRVKHENTA